MIDKLSAKIASFLASEDGCADDRTKIYQIGIDVILSTLITVIGIFILAIIMCNLIGGIIFLLCFVTIRSYSGGYHASTRVRCFFLTCGAYLVTALIVKSDFLDRFPYIMAVTTILDILVFWMFVPVENKNKRLPEDWKVENRRKAWVNLLLWKIIAIAILKVKSEISLQIFITETIITLLILWCVPWKQKKDQNY